MLLPCLAAGAAGAQPLALSPLYELPSPNGCAGETMTMRADAAGRPFLYVAAKDAGLRIYDVAGAPRLVKTVPVAELRSLDVMSLAQAGDRLLLALGDHFSPTAESPGLAVVDVGDPAAAAVLDVWSDPAVRGGAGAVEIDGGYAYLGAMGNGLVIFSLSPAGKLTLMSRLVPARTFPTATPIRSRSTPAAWRCATASSTSPTTPAVCASSTRAPRRTPSRSAAGRTRRSTASRARTTTSCSTATVPTSPSTTAASR